jgi:hypothetical protein
MGGGWLKPKSDVLRGTLALLVLKKTQWKFQKLRNGERALREQ